MATNDDATIRIKKSTREKMKDIGSKRETYDDIINRLMKEKNENRN